MELRLERWRDLMENNRLKVSRAKTEHLQTTGDTDQVMMKRYGDRNYQLANSPVTQISRLNDKQRRRTQQRHGE